MRWLLLLLCLFMLNCGATSPQRETVIHESSIGVVYTDQPSIEGHVIVKAEISDVHVVGFARAGLFPEQTSPNYLVVKLDVTIMRSINIPLSLDCNLSNQLCTLCVTQLHCFTFGE